MVPSLSSSVKGLQRLVFLAGIVTTMAGCGVGLRLDLGEPWNAAPLEDYVEAAVRRQYPLIRVRNTPAEVGMVLHCRQCEGGRPVRFGTRDIIGLLDDIAPEATAMVVVVAPEIYGPGETDPELGLEWIDPGEGSAEEVLARVRGAFDGPRGEGGGSHYLVIAGEETMVLLERLGRWAEEVRVVPEMPLQPAASVLEDVGWSPYGLLTWDLSEGLSRGLEGADLHVPYVFIRY